MGPFIYSSTSILHHRSRPRSRGREATVEGSPPDPCPLHLNPSDRVPLPFIQGCSESHVFLSPGPFVTPRSFIVCFPKRLTLNSDATAESRFSQTSSYRSRVCVRVAASKGSTNNLSGAALTVWRDTWHVSLATVYCLH